MRSQFFGPLTSALPCFQGQIDLIKPYFFRPISELTRIYCHPDINRTNKDIKELNSDQGK